MKNKIFILIVASVSLFFTFSCIKGGKYEASFSVVESFEYSEEFNKKHFTDSLFDKTVFNFSPYLTFNNKHNSGGTFSGGWLLSMQKDSSVLSSESSKPFAVHSKKGGADGSLTFAVFSYDSNLDNMPKSSNKINLPSAESLLTPLFCYVNNTNEVVNEVKKGIKIGSPFVKNDYIKLTAIAYSNKEEIGRADINLADYKNFRDSVITTWTRWDLSKLNTGADEIIFKIESNRANLTQNFCLDNFCFRMFVKL